MYIEETNYKKSSPKIKIVYKFGKTKKGITKQTSSVDALKKVAVNVN